MKKNIIIFIVFAIVIALSVNIKPVLKFTGNVAFKLLAYQFDREIEARKEKAERGEATIGRDTVLIWGKIYEVSRLPEGKYLSVMVDAHSRTILGKVQKTKVTGGKLYVTSENGYAVIDKKEMCRVFLTGQSEATVDFEKVQYLENFEDFEIKEQKRFLKMRN